MIIVAGCETFEETTKEVFVELLYSGCNGLVNFLDYLSSENLYYFSMIPRYYEIFEYSNISIITVEKDKIKGNLFKRIQNKFILFRMFETRFAKRSLATNVIQKFVDDLLDNRNCQKFVVVYDINSHLSLLQKVFNPKPTIYHKHNKYDKANAALVEAKISTGNLPKINLDLCYDGTCDNLPDCDYRGLFLF